MVKAISTPAIESRFPSDFERNPIKPESTDWNRRFTALSPFLPSNNDRRRIRKKKHWSDGDVKCAKWDFLSSLFDWWMVLRFWLFFCLFHDGYSSVMLPIEIPVLDRNLKAAICRVVSKRCINFRFQFLANTSVVPSPVSSRWRIVINLGSICPYRMH